MLKYLAAFFISMIPVLELRGAIPFAVGMDIPYIPALVICTISNHLLTGEETTAEERQNSFTEMMEVALNTAIRL